MTVWEDHDDHDTSYEQGKWDPSFPDMNQDHHF